MDNVKREDYERWENIDKIRAEQRDHALAILSEFTSEIKITPNRFNTLVNYCNLKTSEIANYLNTTSEQIFRWRVFEMDPEDWPFIRLFLLDYFTNGEVTREEFKRLRR